MAAAELWVGGDTRAYYSYAVTQVDKVSFGYQLIADPTKPNGYREMQTYNEMVNLWSTLGFVVETMTGDAPKDIYETEFNKAPPAVMVAAAAR